MTFIIATLTIILGAIVFTSTIGSIILIVFFAIPFTKKLEKFSLLKRNRIVSSYLIKLFIQIVILFLITLPFYVYFRDGPFMSLMIGYALGIVGIIAGIRQWGLNMNNFSDYFETNKDYFWDELVVKYGEDKGKLFEFIVTTLKKQDKQ